ncbi:uncharacterized protein K489DRAFT_408183 [Dissoconium aciculare CBS 342.82]|uniref:Uncharacterized protein n=1 Tax=Dissoconium aciculare CBS 342.82 TaxID=1314786 RepID=A0A6J3MF97_9PEZI|nr:uncharacterized protein K489DRAFT_408183 [Dissoconium aciculare CBS 342.82]KAF1825542.1 hypothetical protein K489DRAFT_408183 [Dissoconium aciculare CBS 342.82]
MASTPVSQPPTVINADCLDPNESPHQLQRPLSGPGASRQTRLLQLRNVGFRGPAMPVRKVTPTARDMLASPWSNAGTDASGANVEHDDGSPIPGIAARTSETRRRTSLLSLDQPEATPSIQHKRLRPRVSSGARHLPLDHLRLGKIHSDDINSPPPPPKSAARLRAVRARAKINHPRRSISAEARKYVEHLEAELVAAQNQISAITSPSATREQSSRVRTLSAETKVLQEELAEWESQYEQRVREGVEQHVRAEAGLRSRIRTLERIAEEARSRADNLEMQLGSATLNLEVIETANVRLEKRLEIMSSLLAASPVKIDLHADTPGRPRMSKVRPKSMLPILPAISTVLDRQPSIPSSPPGHSARPASTKSMSVSHIAISPDDIFSDAESVWSSAALSSHSGMETASWHSHQRHASKSNKRRMRRFVAGSVGPKPLILPATNQWSGSVPASAPGLEREESAAMFSFDHVSRPKDDLDCPVSPSFGRQRAFSTADEIVAAQRRSNILASLEGQFPHLSETVPEEDELDEMLDHTLLASDQNSDLPSHKYSSLGSAAGAAVAGRNLMDELAAVQTPNAKSNSDEFSHSDPSGQSGRGSSGGVPAEMLSSSPFISDVDIDMELPSFPSRVTSGYAADRRMVSNASTAIAVSRPKKAPLAANTLSSPVAFLHSTLAMSSPRVRSSSPLPSAATSTANFSSTDRINSLFAALRLPHLVLARNLINAAHSHMPGGGALLNIQWWLVGMLLGPMARRRMLAAPGADCCLASGTCCNGASTHARRPSAQPITTSSPFRTLSSCCVPQILESPYPFDSDADSDGDDEDDDDDDNLSYGNLYMTPPRPAPGSSLLRISGKGRKRTTPSSASALSSNHSPTRASRSTRHHHYRRHRNDLTCCHQHCTHQTSAADTTTTLSTTTAPASFATRHSPWLWLKFSITLAVAVGAAFRYGPGSLLSSSDTAATSTCCCPKQHQSRCHAGDRCRGVGGSQRIVSLQGEQSAAKDAMSWRRVRREVFGRE